MKFACVKALLLSVLLSLSFSALADNEVRVSVEIPAIEADPYFRPYVAVWLEDEQRLPIETIALWYQVDPSDLTSKKSRKGKKWLKDLRQWWRQVGKAARKDKGRFDAVTGATRKPGSYDIVWDYSHLEAGSYLLNIEASREDGGRNAQRVLVTLGEAGEYAIAAEGELGTITIQID